MGVNNFDLQLINITNANCPTLLKTFDMPELPRKIEVQNNIAYVADGTSGLQLINVSNPSSPTLLGSYNTPDVASDIIVQNGVAYVADFGSSLQIINVSNLSNPTLLSSYSIPGAVYSVTVHNEVVYVADSEYGLQLINVSNASKPTFLSSYDTPGYAQSVTVQNGVAYVPDNNLGLQFINVTNPQNPTFLGSYDTPGNAYSVVVENEVVYLADEGSGMQVLDIGQLHLIGKIPFNATGSYNLRVHATNLQGEWVSTSLVLMLGLPPSTAPSALPPNTSMSNGISSTIIEDTSNSLPRTLSMSNTTSSMIITNSSGSLVSSPTPQTSSPVNFNIVVSQTRILIESGISTFITTNDLSLTGDVNPSQVVYTVQGNNPDVVFTVNGVEVTQFTQADVNSGFVAVTSFVTSCQASSTDVQLQASVAGSTTQVDVSLIFQLTSISCNNADRSVDNTMMNAAALLITTSLGFLTKGRGKRENEEPTQDDECTAAFQLRH